MNELAYILQPYLTVKLQFYKSKRVMTNILTNSAKVSLSPQKVDEAGAEPQNALHLGKELIKLVTMRRQQLSIE